MQHRHLLKPLLTFAVVGTFLVSVALPSGADDATRAKPLALRKIMRDMGENMQKVTDAISREDWSTVGKIAPLIADHPQPPLAEKLRILSFIGADTAKFRGYDGKTHDAAKALEQAAARGDGPSLISSFAELQNSCLGCHQNFRKQFLEHFYGQR